MFRNGRWGRTGFLVPTKNSPVPGPVSPLRLTPAPRGNPQILAARLCFSTGKTKRTATRNSTRADRPERKHAPSATHCSQRPQLHPCPLRQIIIRRPALEARTRLSTRQFSSPPADLPLPSAPAQPGPSQKSNLRRARLGQPVERSSSNYLELHIIKV